MSYRLVVIRDLSHLSQSITDFGSSAGEVWFRGESVHHHDLEPSAYRSDPYTLSSADIEHRSISLSKTKMFDLPGTHKLKLKLQKVSLEMKRGILFTSPKLGPINQLNKFLMIHTENYNSCS